jgi:hypothetical protein
MRRPDTRTSGAAAVRLLVAAAVVAVVAGCTVAIPPPPGTSTPPLTTAGTRTDPATRTAAGASSTPHVTQTASAVSLAAFAGQWSGHTRSLTVSASGSGHETVYDGCCTQQIDMTFRLSNPHGTSAAHATATATVTAVALYATLGPAPKIGQTGTVSLIDGVLTDSLDGVTYCNQAAAEHSACGA